MADMLDRSSFDEPRPTWTPTGRRAMIPAVKQQLHIKVSGGLEGDFVITEERSENEFVITREPEPSWKAVQARAGAREMTDQEWKDFISEHGSHMLPPDGEG
jgi:hypothetical protein